MADQAGIISLKRSTSNSMTSSSPAKRTAGVSVVFAKPANSSNNAPTSTKKERPKYFVIPKPPFMYKIVKSSFTPAVLLLVLFLPLSSLLYTPNVSVPPDDISHSGATSGSNDDGGMRSAEQMMLSARDAHGGLLLDPLGRSDPICQSQYRTRGSTRGSPLIFERDGLMVCQTPKIGTTELRCIQSAYDARRNFSDYDPMWEFHRSQEPRGGKCNPRFSESLSELMEIEDEATFNRYLFGDDITRIMFVRHPVRRILSGFLQVARDHKKEFWTEYKFKGGNLGYGPDAFRNWIFNSTFMFQYDPVCSHASTYFSREIWWQHFAPPQHCRCGIWDCDAQWKVYKIEEHPVAEVMERHIPGPWNPKGVPPLHRKSYDEKEYLTPEVLKALNHLTRIEQEFFGYEPLEY